MPSTSEPGVSVGMPAPLDLARSPGIRATRSCWTPTPTRCRRSCAEESPGLFDDEDVPVDALHEPRLPRAREGAALEPRSGRWPAARRRSPQSATPWCTTSATSRSCSSAAGPDRSRPYYNACLHRGRQLRVTSPGCVHELRCPFHGFSWNLDGSLKSIIPTTWDFPHAQDKDMRLPQVQGRHLGRLRLHQHGSGLRAPRRTSSATSTSTSRRGRSSSGTCEAHVVQGDAGATGRSHRRRSPRPCTSSPRTRSCWPASATRTASTTSGATSTGPSRPTASPARTSSSSRPSRRCSTRWSTRGSTSHRCSRCPTA